MHGVRRAFAGLLAQRALRQVRHRWGARHDRRGTSFLLLIMLLLLIIP
jgi:hypothetical protein